MSVIWKLSRDEAEELVYLMMKQDLEDAKNWRLDYLIDELCQSLGMSRPPPPEEDKT